MSILVKLAMNFAEKVHVGQVRKYVGNPYFDHLAEVAEIVGRAEADHPDLEKIVAVAWLHDCVEDCGVRYADLAALFGPEVADGVLMLSDMEGGSRAERKAASRARLGKAEGWVQSVKCADLISNTASIAERDPLFAVGYLREKRALLAHLGKAHPALFAEAMRYAYAPVQLNLFD